MKLVVSCSDAPHTFQYDHAIEPIMPVGMTDVDMSIPTFPDHLIAIYFRTFPDANDILG